MRPRDDIPIFYIQDALQASVGDILRTLNEIGTEQALVTMLNKGTPTVRGLFSATHIAHELKILLEPKSVSSTFEELNRAFSHHGNGSGSFDS